jgi:hypothetical protein
MYQTAMLIVLTHFSEQAYNQETGVFNTQYTMIAKNLIDVISRGEYLNTDLTEQVSTKSAARLVTVSISNDLRTYIDDCQELILDSFPGV